MGETEPVEFRCLGCGAVAAIAVSSTWVVLTLTAEPHPRKPPAPRCGACGGRSWVRCGSMTEFYRYQNRADVCRVGDHVDARAQPYTLRPRSAIAPRAGTVEIAELHVRACPDHVAHLRTEGILGYVLGDPIDEA